MHRHTCCIIPGDVLDKLAGDDKLPAKLRKASADTARVTTELKKLRVQAGQLTSTVQLIGASLVQLATKPKVTVYDTQHSQTLPGTPVKNARAAKDPTTKRAYAETTKVAEFFKKVFNRNSIDNAGMTLMSSVHYGTAFNNALWNGTQMVYGDGDGKIFVDFTQGNDVIGHELTHGITQHTLQLGYTDEAGGLNESLSDCFGAMFQQWQAKQDVTKASWLIGADIIGSTAKARGYTCIRNMANPADSKSLTPQPVHYSQLTPGMDPHYSSGPPNLAFQTACKAVGGKSWETVGQVWYNVLTESGAVPGMKMADFAARTRAAAVQMFEAGSKSAIAVDAGWKLVGL
jgi:Zn-dependent metalloprotease